MIGTKRLNLYPASREQMEEMILSEQDGELKKAYTEMLGGCLRFPDQWEWYAMWMIELKSGEHIGDLCFKGLLENGSAEIGYGILEEYRGQGYASEALEAAIEELFRMGFEFVKAGYFAENPASRRVMEKCGMHPLPEEAVIPYRGIDHRCLFCGRKSNRQQ